MLRRVEERNYRPNLAARALVTGKTHLMGLVVPDLVHSFFSQIANAISKVLREHRYSLVIASSQEDPELEAEEIDQLLARSVDCLFIATTQLTLRSFRRIEEHETPYILMDRKLPKLAANFVGVDDVQVGYLATKHLVEIGCRRIAHIGTPYLSPAVGRLEGYRRALRDYGIHVPARYVLVRPHGDDAGDTTGYEVMKRLLSLRPLPEAVFCHNDPTALGAMKAILDAGLRIPEDIAIIGCGNVMYSDCLRVPLTTDRSGLQSNRLKRCQTRPQPVGIQDNSTARNHPHRAQAGRSRFYPPIPWRRCGEESSPRTSCPSRTADSR